MLRRTLLLALIITTVGALDASSALALRYASASGTSAQNCQTVATACDLTTAVHGVVGNLPSADEEVVVEPGTYPVTATIEAGAMNLHIHGADGQPRPKITGSVVDLMHGIEINLRYLEFDGTGTGEVLGISGGTLDRLLIQGNSGGNVLCQCYLGTLRDSVVVVTGGLGAVGLGSNGGSATEDYRNDTFISTASTSAAIFVQQQSSSPGSTATLALTAENVIARNLAGGASVMAYQGAATQQTTVTLHHSDLGTTAVLGGAAVIATDADITAAPLFADAANGDFHELAGSPTIDAGIDDALNGTLDFDGAARSVATTDMGAFEYQPPVIVPPVTTTTDPTTTGLTTTDATPDAPGAPAPDAPAGAPAIPAALTPPRLSVSGRTFAVNARTGNVSVRALCAAPAGTTCAISGTLRAAKGLPGARHAKPVTIGTLRGTLPAGGRGTLTLSLSHAAVAALRATARHQGRHLTATLTATVRAAGAAGTLTARITVSVRRAAA